HQHAAAGIARRQRAHQPRRAGTNDHRIKDRCAVAHPALPPLPKNRRCHFPVTANKGAHSSRVCRPYLHRIATMAPWWWRERSVKLVGQKSDRVGRRLTVLISGYHESIMISSFLAPRERRRAATPMAALL